MSRFLRKSEFAAFAVEFDAPFDQLFDIFRAVVDERCDRFDIAQTRARNQSIFFVQFGVVVVRQHNRDTALRVFGIRLLRFIFGQNRDPRTALRQLNRSAKSGDSAADNDKIRF